MVDRTAGERAVVFVDDGERGRSDTIGYLQLVAERLDEGGFTGSEPTIEGYDGVLLEQGQKFLGSA